MLIYQAEGFLEVEDDAIIELYRSAFTVTAEEFDLSALLCLHRAGEKKQCHVAFYNRALKRSLVFSVKDSSPDDALQQGKLLLESLEFRLEPVNLKLSPAMRQVVLRDISGILPPAAARDFRTEKANMLAELERSVEEKPESAQAQKAKRKLSAEQRLNDKAIALRELLEAKFAPPKTADEDSQILTTQVSELTEKLEQAQLAAEEERRQRIFAEEILAAAEKRLQELEAILVDVETRTATGLNDRKRAVQLESRINELSEELEAARGQSEADRSSREQLVQDVKSAHERIQTLEADLAQGDEIVAELNEARSIISKLENRQQKLVEELKLARKNLIVAEANCSEMSMAAKVDAAADKDMAHLRQQLAELEAELEVARDDLEGERTIRSRLEVGAKEDAKKIRQLDKKLLAGAEVPADGSGQGALSAQLREESAARLELESELNQAHSMIEALEKALKGSRSATTADSAELAAMAAQVNSLELQLEQQQLEQKRSASVQLAAQKYADSLEKELAQLKLERESAPAAAVAAPPAEKKAAATPLPHQLKPAPKKGALFYPNWDLSALPCNSVKQIHVAWESTFNVQMSLEGYPSQYCSAFLVVLKEGKKQAPYLLFRLTKSKHTLVCQWSVPPRNDAEIKKAVKDGQQYLQMSGFDLEKLTPGNVQEVLGGYLLK